MSPISEDELRVRLEDVQPSPARHGFAEQVVQQARRRRRRQRWVMGAAAAAAVAVIGAGTLAIGDQIGRDEALPASPTPTSAPVETAPVETTPTVTSTGTPTPTPTATATASAARPTASATSAPSSTPTRPAPLEPTPTPVPVLPPPPSPPAIEPAWEALHPVTLLHAGSWTVTNTFAGPCGRDVFGIAGLRDAYRYDARRIEGGEGRADGEAYVLFAAEDGAAAFMDDLQAQGRACSFTTDGATGGVVEQLSGPWSDGLALSHISGQPNVTGGSVVLAVRSGRAVTLSSASGSFTRTDHVDPALIRAARPSVEHVYPQLCGFTDEGC
ncbi:hypothetical protein ACOCJ4_16150 [Knoellia sp. CPCC 206435]|uniref:hypothetical protein n=1 Tax=Knoellia terrae TaxID=3404797 RepID=UPI003B429FEE